MIDSLLREVLTQDILYLLMALPVVFVCYLAWERAQDRKSMRARDERLYQTLDKMFAMSEKWHATLTDLALVIERLK